MNASTAALDTTAGPARRRAIVPPIAATPAAADAITMSGSTLQVPD